MVYSLKRRPHAKKHGRRKNPKAVKRNARRVIKTGKHRPVIVYSGGSWFRSKKSKLLPSGTRINPKTRKRHYRRNPMPKLPFNLEKVAIGGLKVAGGITIGFTAMPIICKFMPASLTTKYRRFYGLLHVVLGAAAAAFVKKPIVKDMALLVAGTGIYDLIASNIPMLGLPALPSASSLLSGDEDPGVIGMEADYAPALGASYQAMGASYGADDISYGGDGDDSIEL